MLNPNKLHAYQKRAVNFQCCNESSMMWLDMGLGKTIITLTSVAHLLTTKYLSGVLIIAPIRVIQTVWEKESRKWAHTNHLKFSYITGTRDQRTRALLKTADVYLLSYDNIKWLSDILKTHYIKKGKPLPFNGIVWDEVSKMKNSSTQRVKSFKAILQAFKWKTGLTGTPASNGYKDLHGQFLVVDNGDRLGTSKTAFRQRFYYKVGPYTEVPYKDTEEVIKSLIGDITLEMSADDYNQLPKLIFNDIEMEMPPDIQAKYDSLEKDLFLELDSGTNIELFNKSALTGKCLQFANGAVYPLPGVPLWENLHDIKLSALDDIIEEANGHPVLCAYSYRSDAARIMEYFSHLKPVNITECKTKKSLEDAINYWKSGNCRLMIGHPASMGHGIDGLQDNGHTLVWFGLTWSLDLFDQFNARLRRQGQTKPVICHRLMIKDTLDKAQLIALETKGDTQTSLRKAIKEYRKSRPF